MCKGRGHNASKRPSPAPSPQPLAPGILSNFLGLLPLLLAEEFFRKLRPRLASPRRQQAPLKGKAASRSPESHRPAQPTEFRSLSSLSRPPSRCPVVGTAPFLAGGCGPRPAPVRGAPPVSSGLAGRAQSAPPPLLSEAVVSLPSPPTLRPGLDGWRVGVSPGSRNSAPGRAPSAHHSSEGPWAACAARDATSTKTRPRSRGRERNRRFVLSH